jgi:hypothetical protein
MYIKLIIIYAVTSGATCQRVLTSVLYDFQLHVLLSMPQPHVRPATTPLKEGGLTPRVQPRIRLRMQTRVVVRSETERPPAERAQQLVLPKMGWPA